MFQRPFGAEIRSKCYRDTRLNGIIHRAASRVACDQDRPGRVAGPGYDERLRLARHRLKGSLGGFARSCDRSVAAGVQPLRPARADSGLLKRGLLLLERPCGLAARLRGGPHARGTTLAADPRRLPQKWASSRLFFRRVHPIFTRLLLGTVFITSSLRAVCYCVHGAFQMYDNLRFLRRMIVLASSSNAYYIRGRLSRGTTPRTCDCESATGVPSRSTRQSYFWNVTLLTEKERARCLYMSIGVINMACSR